MQNNILNKIISINELWQFFNRSATLFCITGADGYLKQVNPHVIKILEFTEEQLLSTPYINFIHPDDREYSVQQSEKVRQKLPAIQFRNRILTKSDTYKFISWTATYIADEDNVYLIGQDYTEIQMIENQLNEEKLNKQKSILEAALSAQEKERADIGKELHDNINQMLASVLLYNQMALVEKDHYEERIAKSNEIVQKSIAEIRYLSKSLVGPAIRQIGLIDSILELIETIQSNTNLLIAFRRVGNLEKLPAKLKLTIFRIVQEQFNNIIKHAAAKKVDIHLILDSKCLTLIIKDDGKGFNINNKKKGIGLSNIVSRIELFNGHLFIDSSPGFGCSLTITIPAAEISSL